MTKTEMERLKVGEIVQNKECPRLVYMVSQVFPDKVILVSTKEMRNPDEWDVVKDELIPQIKYTIQEAADEIDEDWQGSNWFTAVGIDTPLNETLHIYTKLKKFKKPFGDTYGGFKVEWHYTPAFQ